jgi:L-fucose isomerase-like protein
VYHHGIVYRMTVDMMGGVFVEIANNLPRKGVVLSDWIHFSEGRAVQVVHHASSPAHIQQIAARVESGLGKPYNLFSQNCEHFASFAFTGKWESSSMRFLGVVAGAIFVGRLLRA